MIMWNTFVQRRVPRVVSQLKASFLGITCKTGALLLTGRGIWFIIQGSRRYWDATKDDTVPSLQIISPCLAKAKPEAVRLRTRSQIALLCGFATTKRDFSSFSFVYLKNMKTRLDRSGGIEQSRPRRDLCASGNGKTGTRRTVRIMKFLQIFTESFWNVM
jgi:hypothetical protein